MAKESVRSGMVTPEKDIVEHMEGDFSRGSNDKESGHTTSTEMGGHVAKFSTGISSEYYFRPVEGKYKGIILTPSWRSFDVDSDRTKLSATIDGKRISVGVDELSGTDVQLLTDVDIKYDHLNENEKREIKIGVDIWKKLSDAFGGRSLVSNDIIGMALVGHVGRTDSTMPITAESIEKQIQYLIDSLCDYWVDIMDSDPDPSEIREQIITGMKKRTEKWKGQYNDDPIWTIIDVLEKSNH